MDFNLNFGGLEKEDSFIDLDPGTLYDVLILGGGPAGLTAAVYCMRKGVKTGIIIKSIGGQVADTAGIENYMGYVHISGLELAQKFKEQVTQFGIGYDEGSSVEKIEDGAQKKVYLDDGRVFKAKTLIITTGKRPRMLNVPGEQEFTGRGVAYCATCDAPFFKDKNVYVAGGGNSGLESALDLAAVASKVTIIQFLEDLTADKILVDKFLEKQNSDVLYEHQVLEIKGDSNVRSLVLKDRKSEEEKEVEADGIFVEIGLEPNSAFAKGAVEMNKYDEIIVDCACKTSAPGIFAAGDVTTVPFKQIIIAGGEGAKAALSACDYIMKN